MSRCSFGDLPGDIVSIVADRADVECRPRMRAVCSAWRAAVPVEPQPPWILLQPDDTVTQEAERTRRGFSVLSLPADANLSHAGSSVNRCLDAIPAGSRCVGAGHGWLALVGTDLSVTLQNPVTGCAVSLPPLTRHPMVGGLRDDGLVRWCTWLDRPHSGKLVPVGEFVDTFVRKVVFSAAPEQDDYFAVVVGDRMSYAMYARAGATEWKTLRDDAYDKPVSLVHDVVHVEGGRFLAVTRCHGKVLELDLTAQGWVGENGGFPARVSLFAGSLASAESAYSFGHTNVNMENHLVLVDGELYQIWASWLGEPVPEEEEEDSDEAVNRYYIDEVGVVRFDPARSTCWSEAVDLGDWAVLVGRNETAAVRADVPGLRGGCAYFIDSRLDELLCAFDLRTGQAVETVSCDTLREWWATARATSSFTPPVWFLPSSKARRQGSSPTVTLFQKLARLLISIFWWFYSIFR